MIFQLTRVKSPRPRPTARYSQHSDRPIVPLEVFGRSGSVWTDALLDSGSDDFLPLRLAARLGVDLGGIPSGTSQGVGAPQTIIQYAEVILRLTDGTEECRWRAIVAFSAHLPRHALFGIAGGLEYFRYILDVDMFQAELIAKPTLPRTDDPFA